jgi:hypothetical protein
VGVVPKRLRSRYLLPERRVAERPDDLLRDGAENDLPETPLLRLLIPRGVEKDRCALNDDLEKDRVIGVRGRERNPFRSWIEGVIPGLIDCEVRGAE